VVDHLDEVGFDLPGSHLHGHLYPRLVAVKHRRRGNVKQGHTVEGDRGDLE
jgi:hypothetical protein